MQRNKSGRRFQDKLIVKSISLFVAFYVGHLITSMFPDINFIAEIMEISLDFARWIRTMIYAVGGVPALYLLFKIYKWQKERKI